MNTTITACVPGIGFSDQPDEVRMLIRGMVEDMGAIVDGYYDGSLQLSMPSDPESRRAIGLALYDAGMRLKSSCLFPLGSDKPPESMRHDGRYPGSKGFWMHSTYSVSSGL